MLQPDYPSAMGLLTHLNSDELKEMLNDDTKFESVLKDIKQVKNWETEKEMMIASNRSLAEFNLSKEPEIEKLKAELMSRSQVGEQLSTNIQELLEEYKSKSAGISPDLTLALLQTAAAESEEASENIAQDFVLGKTDVDKFLEDFTPMRKIMHLRKFKSDKMNEIMRNKMSYGNGYPKQNLPYPKYGAQVPYPVGPMNMPMPGNLFNNHF